MFFFNFVPSVRNNYLSYRVSVSVVSTICTCMNQSTMSAIRFCQSDIAALIEHVCVS